MTENLYSFHELVQVDQIQPPPSDILQASDGTELSYSRYVPPNPRAVVLFYHGAGAHSEAGYQFIGHNLQSEFDLAVYIPDMRGHGTSQGKRGDAPSPIQVWSDIGVFIKKIREDYPGLPLYLGGHSSGAGMVLNYACLPDRESVTGYLLLSPQLGPHAKADRSNLRTPYASIDNTAFAAYVMSGGKLRGNHYAVKFNYPPEILAHHPELVTAITVNMAVAITPIAPDKQFEALDRPFGLWIGSDDELFSPDKVLAFADKAKSVRADSTADILTGEKHLSILINAHKAIGSWIDGMLQAQNH